MWEFTIVGDPVPWTSWPKRGAPPAGFLNMQAWQAQIQAYAIRYWRGPDGPVEPLSGPVRLELEFYLPQPKKPTNKYPRADVTNLTKACEDALQGILFVNDSQVVVTSNKKAYVTGSDAGYTVIRVERLTD